MKKTFIIVIISISLLLASCTNNLEKDDDINVSNKQDCSYIENYDVYSFTVSDDKFSSAISDNPIDKAYIKELEEDTNELSEIERKYIQLWIEEMRASVSKYVQYLSDEDKKEFERNQDNWEKTSVDNLNFEKDILTNSDYNLKLSSSFRYLWLSELRETYRQRTIRIKYLTYLFEQNLSDDNSVDIEFYYKA